MSVAAARFVLAEDPQRLAEERAAFFEANPVPVCDLDVLLDHFDHAIEIAGPDHVGIGADWDGVISMPAGMEDVTRLPDLTAGLLARGHSRETVRKVLGENVLRALEEAERVDCGCDTPAWCRGLPALRFAPGDSATATFFLKPLPPPLPP